MKFTRRQLLIVAILLLLLAAAISMFIGRSEKPKTPPVLVERAVTFTYDTADVRQAVGMADYVFAGKVVRELPTEFPEPGEPRAMYEVEVTQNLKGKLATDRPITVAKEGGVGKDGNQLYLFENDELPLAGHNYVFLAYAQPDGSPLISGPHSNTLLDAEYQSEPLTNPAAKPWPVPENPEERIPYFEEAIKNEVIPEERERFPAKDAVE